MTEKDRNLIFETLYKELNNIKEFLSDEEFESASDKIMKNWGGNIESDDEFDPMEFFGDAGDAAEDDIRAEFGDEEFASFGSMEDPRMLKDLREEAQVLSRPRHDNPQDEEEMMRHLSTGEDFLDSDEYKEDETGEKVTYYVKGVDPNDKFYPDADDWMWNYCVFLGKFTDSKGRDYDLGIYPGAKYGRHYSAAIVYSNEPGDYASGDLPGSHGFEAYNETFKRALDAGWSVKELTNGLYNAIEEVPTEENKEELARIQREKDAEFDRMWLNNDDINESQSGLFEIKDAEGNIIKRHALVAPVDGVNKTGRVMGFGDDGQGRMQLLVTWEWPMDMKYTNPEEMGDDRVYPEDVVIANSKREQSIDEMRGLGKGVKNSGDRNVKLRDDHHEAPLTNLDESINNLFKNKVTKKQLKEFINEQARKISKM